MAETQRLVLSGRDATVKVIVHIAEIERRRIHLTGGHASLFAYCTDVRRLSEHEAYHRILAARTVSSFPRILDMLAAGRLNLTTVRQIAQYLTPENHQELLAAIAGKTRSEVELLVAARFPKPDVPTSVRRLPAPILPAPTLTPATSQPVAPANPTSTDPVRTDIATTPPRRLRPPWPRQRRHPSRSRRRSVPSHPSAIT